MSKKTTKRKKKSEQLATTEHEPSLTSVDGLPGMEDEEPIELLTTEEVRLNLRKKAVDKILLGAEEKPKSSTKKPSGPGRSFTRKS